MPRIAGNNLGTKGWRHATSPINFGKVMDVSGSNEHASAVVVIKYVDSCSDQILFVTPCKLSKNAFGTYSI